MDDNRNSTRGSSRKLKQVSNDDETHILGKRRILPTLSGGEINIGNFPFYILILPGLAAKKLHVYLRNNWLALDALTGDHALLVTPVIPAHTSREYLTWWQTRLPKKDFLLLKEKLARGLEPGIEDRAMQEVYRLAEQRGIAASKLPLMLVTVKTDNGLQEGLSIPLNITWDDITISKFFEQFSDKCKNASLEQDARKRLELLRFEVDKLLAATKKTFPPSSALKSSVAVEVLRQGVAVLLEAVVPILLKAILGQ